MTPKQFKALRDECCEKAATDCAAWAKAHDLNALGEKVFLIDSLVEIARRFFMEKVTALQARCAALEAKLATVEAAGTKTIADSYDGVFRRGASYERGRIVTWDGSMWVAIRDTANEPGHDDSGWRLCVKRGRNARDSR